MDKAIFFAGLAFLAIATLVLANAAANWLFEGRANVRGAVRYVMRTMIAGVVIVLLVWLAEITRGWR